MKNIIQTLMLISMGLFLNACYYDAFPEEEDVIPPSEDVSYENDVMPLWVQCSGCHSGNLPPDLRDEFSYDALLNGYVTPGNADTSTLYKSLLNTGGVSLMPPSGEWPAHKIDLVAAWINQGAKDN